LDIAKSTTFGSPYTFVLSLVLVALYFFLLSMLATIAVFSLFVLFILSFPTYSALSRNNENWQQATRNPT
jgi:hypothetical protein